MACRKVALGTGHYHHIFTRSIADYVVFRNDREYERMVGLLRFYRCARPGVRFSWFVNDALPKYKEASAGMPRVRVLAYCLMPTHIHLFLEQIDQSGISDYMRLVLNSYAKYFNKKTNRNGPLWESRFKNVLVETNEQALHLTRYIHLNPTSAGLEKDIHVWKYSSLGEYLGEEPKHFFCEFKDVVDLSPERYRQFLEDRKGYQRELQIIKGNMLD